MFILLVALSLKSPTRGVSIKYCVVLYCFVTMLILEGADTGIEKTRHCILYVWVNNSNSCDRVLQMEEQNYEAEI